MRTISTRQSRQPVARSQAFAALVILGGAGPVAAGAPAAGLSYGVEL